MNIEFATKNNTVLTTSNGVEIAVLVLSSEGCGDFYIQKIEVSPEARGNGLYKKMLRFAFEALKINSLRSDNRNRISNQIYENWMGCELEFNQPVFITCENQNLEFYA